MSIKACNSLEVTGNFMEIPPAKEPTTSRLIERKRLSQIDLNSKRKSSILSLSTTTKSSISNRSTTQRSFSQLSNQSNKKLNSNVSDASSSNQYEDEIKRLKKRIEELELQVKLTQKQSKEKEKIIDDLNKKVNDSIQKEFTANQKLADALKLIESLKQENESLTRQLDINHELKSVEFNKIKEDLNRFKLQHESEVKKLKEIHANEVKVRDDKLDNLKKQIAGAFKDNSWERQLQIDELTKELKRAQEECELIKHKLKGYKNKHSNSCSNCANMLHKLEENALGLRERESFILDLITVMKNKLQTNQINLKDELTKLTGSHYSNNNNNNYKSYSNAEFLNKLIVDFNNHTGGANYDVKRKESLKYNKNKS